MYNSGLIDPAGKTGMSDIKCVVLDDNHYWVQGLMRHMCFRDVVYMQPGGINNYFLLPKVAQEHPGLVLLACNNHCDFVVAEKIFHEMNLIGVPVLCIVDKSELSNLPDTLKNNSTPIHRDDSLLDVKSKIENAIFNTRPLTEQLKFISSSDTFFLPALNSPSRTLLLLRERLSLNEFIVIIKLVSGSTLAEIAELIGVGIKTISAYKISAKKKLNFRSDAEMVMYISEIQPHRIRFKRFERKPFLRVVR